MPDEAIGAGQGARPVLRLTVINATDADQNFGLLVRPGPVEVVPDTGPVQVLAWKVAFVPGRSASVTSRCHFEWSERRALMLGRFGRGADPHYLAEAVLPVAAGSETFRIGFVGSPDNGAAKLAQIEGGSEHTAVLTTDGSFPSPLSRTGSTRRLALAAALDPEDDLAGAALAVPLASNMVLSVAWLPQYQILSLPPGTHRGGAVAREMSDAGYKLDFDGRDAITVQFTDRNAFEVV